MELQHANINTNSFIVGGTIIKIKSGKTKQGNDWVLGSLLNILTVDDLQFPLKTFLNFKCFGNDCKKLEGVKEGSTVVFQGYYASDCMYKKNGEKQYTLTLFVKCVKVLSYNTEKPNKVGVDIFNEEDLPF